jgi:hypothetical protein
MTQKPLECPKCAGHMESGFMIERGGGPRDRQVRWVEGEPIPTLWFAGVKIQDQEPIPVTTYRCSGCGYLESFAIPPA